MSRSFVNNAARISADEIAPVIDYTKLSGSILASLQLVAGEAALRSRLHFCRDASLKKKLGAQGGIACMAVALSLQSQGSLTAVTK